MGNVAIWAGNAAKILKSILDINGNAQILSGTTDPTSVATSAPKGSLYLNTSTGLTYQKQDAGSSTNWTALSAGSTGAWVSVALASGSRVTATPSATGQYRTYIKTINSASGTDNAPTTGPSSADGMKIYGNVSYGNAGTSGQPGRWEVFCGAGKQVAFYFWSSTGKSGWISVNTWDDVDPGTGTITRYGLFFSYNSSTGVAVVDGFNQDSATVSRVAGQSIPTAGGSPTNATFVYFDIFVI